MPSPATLRRIFLDVLFRNPTAAEATSYANTSPADTARALYATAEAASVWLEEELLYYLLIDNFRPDTAAVKSLPERLHARRIDVREATAEILLSTGFSLRNPGNDTFVTVVLEQCLGLEVQDRKNLPVLEAGKKVYDGYATRFLGGTGKTQADVVKLAIADRRFAAHLLDRHHRRLFAQPLPNNAADAIDIVHGQPATLFEVLVQWLASERYLDEQRPRRTCTHHQFARSLYLDLLGRLPSYDELRMVRNALLAMADPRPLRAVLVKVILDSGRAKLPATPARADTDAFVRACFGTYLRRSPTDAEVKAIAAAMWAGQNPDVSVLARALVGSEEYGSY